MFFGGVWNILPDECPLKEETPLRPWTPYGVSKVGVEMLGRQYYLNYGMEIFLPRMFIHVGNLDTARDFINVRDDVRAMQLLMEKEQYGIPINICNGK